jgi:hypothetical protein
MSQDPDRIAVPTNGRRPHPLVTPEPAAPSEADSGAPSDEEMSTAFTPKNLAIGFGIVASLVLLLVGAARRRRPGA